MIQLWGAEAIIRERIRQQEEEGYTERNDANYGEGQLLWAAVSYLLATLVNKKHGYEKWPWGRKNEGMEGNNTFKPKDARRNLERAGALIAAELDRLKEKAAKEGLEF